MERRFTAALVSAAALHVALLGLCAWFVAAGTAQAPPRATQPEIEVVLIEQDVPATAGVPSSETALSRSSTVSKVPAAAPVDLGRASLPSAAALLGETDAGEVTPVQPGASDPSVMGADGSSDVPQAVGEAPRRHIDLGLDGAIVARALRDTHQRAPARRPVVAFDGWSESVVRSVAHMAAPSESSALLTVEWDAHGRLASIRSSAESSHKSTWRKLVALLRNQLARRPQGSTRRLQLVYLVKSEVVQPGKRSQLPESRHVSAEQLRDEYLPPAVSLNVGVKADSSAAGQRVVSVTLASSQVL